LNAQESAIMTKAGTPTSTDATELFALRAEFLDRVWLGLLVVASLAVPVSLGRAFLTGWQPLYGVQFFLLLVVGGAYLLRRRLALHARALIVIAVLDFNGIASVLSLGLFGASWWWLFMSSLIAGTFFRVRDGMAHALGAGLVLMGIGLAFIQGILVLDFDANAYNEQFFPWAWTLLGPVLFTLFVFWAFEPFLKALAQRAP
jgi:hypothetical protein